MVVLQMDLRLDDSKQSPVIQNSIYSNIQKPLKVIPHSISNITYLRLRICSIFFLCCRPPLWLSKMARGNKGNWVRRNSNTAI